MQATCISLSLLGLVSFGAWASARATGAAGYALSIPLPVAPSHHVIRAVGPVSASGHTAPRRASLMKAAAPVGSKTAFGADDEPYVAAAVKTGEFQEWVGRDGRDRFLTAGPASDEGGRQCRDLALLTRLPGGGSHVGTTRACAVGSAHDAAGLSDKQDGSPRSSPVD